MVSSELSVTGDVQERLDLHWWHCCWWWPDFILITLIGVHRKLDVEMLQNKNTSLEVEQTSCPFSRLYNGYHRVSPAVRKTLAQHFPLLFYHRTLTPWSICGHHREQTLGKLYLPQLLPIGPKSGSNCLFHTAHKLKMVLHFYTALKKWARLFCDVWKWCEIIFQCS